MICALLSWYEESPSFLAATVSSLARLADHVVAVDGAYAAFPGGRARSGPEQADTIQEVAAGSGIGCTIHTPRTVWAGGEIEKRSFLFKLALTVCEPGRDWLLCIDADEVVTQAPPDMRGRLDGTSLDVATVTLWHRNDLHAPGVTDAARQLMPCEGSELNMRVLLRALPGLRVEHAHHVYTDGRVFLRSNFPEHELEAALDCRDVRIEHRVGQRAQDRQRRSAVYYRTRDAAGLETMSLAAV